MECNIIGQTCSINVFLVCKNAFWCRSVYPFLTYNVLNADMLRYAVTLTFDPLTLNLCGVLAVTCSNSVLQFIKDDPESFFRPAFHGQFYLIRTTSKLWSTIIGAHSISVFRCCSVLNPHATALENDGQISHFCLTSLKISGGCLCKMP